ncbi:MAG: restriction endonuclease [Anaerolineae bacterium]|nr:restriction endonuclease [Anaerolineae bacterium]
MQKSSNWRDFEKLVETIYRERDPNAVVKRNHRIVGISGRRRQLDVTLTIKTPLHSVFVVIECKDHRRPVGIESVDEFATKLRDVRANLGVLVSSSGFDAGARAQAQTQGIVLKSLRDAQSEDWHRITNGQSWISLYLYAPKSLQIVVSTNKRDIELKFEAYEDLRNSAPIVFHTGDSSQSIVLQSFIADLFTVPVPPEDIRAFIANAVVLPGTAFEFEGEYLEVNELRITGIQTVRAYIVNLHLSGGYVLSDETGGKDAFSLQSNSIDLEHLTKQPYTELTAEEYGRITEQSARFRSFNLSGAERYLRVVLQEKRDSNE